MATAFGGTATASATGGNGGSGGTGFAGGAGGNATAFAEGFPATATAQGGTPGPGSSQAIGGTADAKVNGGGFTLEQIVPGGQGYGGYATVSIGPSGASGGGGSGGSLTLTGPGTLPISSIPMCTSLIIGDGTTATTLQLPANSAPTSIGSLTINAGSAFDITNNQVFICYGNGPDPIASIAAWIANGYYGLSGPAIISSSIAADDAASGLSYGIGYADGADGAIAGLPSGEIEIMFTLLGDANLDGTVNSEDFTPFSHNLGQSGMMWDDGDFNYDGTVNSEDFTLFSHNVGQSATLASQAGVLDAANGIKLENVPEPASIGLVIVGLVGMLGRRHRLSRKDLVSDI
jgi:hypothetical protein